MSISCGTVLGTGDPAVSKTDQGPVPWGSSYCRGCGNGQEAVWTVRQLGEGELSTDLRKPSQVSEGNDMLGGDFKDVQREAARALQKFPWWGQLRPGSSRAGEKRSESSWTGRRHLRV